MNLIYLHVQSERFLVANAEFSRGNYRLVGGSFWWLSYPPQFMHCLPHPHVYIRCHSELTFKCPKKSTRCCVWKTTHNCQVSLVKTQRSASSRTAPILNQNKAQVTHPSTVQVDVTFDISTLSSSVVATGNNHILA